VRACTTLCESLEDAVRRHRCDGHAFQNLDGRDRYAAVQLYELSRPTISSSAQENYKHLPCARCARHGSCATCETIPASKVYMSRRDRKHGLHLVGTVLQPEADSIAARLGGRSFSWCRLVELRASRYIPWPSSLCVTDDKDAGVSCCRERPAVVFVMTPPVSACCPRLDLLPCTGGSFVSECSYGAFLDPRWPHFCFLHKWFFPRCAKNEP